MSKEGLFLHERKNLGGRQEENTYDFWGDRRKLWSRADEWEDVTCHLRKERRIAPTAAGQKAWDCPEGRWLGTCRWSTVQQWWVTGILVILLEGRHWCDGWGGVSHCPASGVQKCTYSTTQEGHSCSEYQSHQTRVSAYAGEEWGFMEKAESVH